MKPRGLLMIEHRLIEKMLKKVEQVILPIDRQKGIDPVLVDTLVDFIRIYADRTHHGKEEDLLFKALEQKKMSAEEQAMMGDLVKEHQTARATVRDLVEAKKKFEQGDRSALETLEEKLYFLIRFYPVHIVKEDRVFFENTEKYFSPSELEDLLNQFWKFDQGMIHEKYKNVVAELGA
jgi:hemerythrin-like domain-containing protein